MATRTAPTTQHSLDGFVPSSAPTTLAWASTRVVQQTTGGRIGPRNFRPLMPWDTPVKPDTRPSTRPPAWPCPSQARPTHREAPRPFVPDGRGPAASYRRGRRGQGGTPRPSQGASASQPPSLLDQDPRRGSTSGARVPWCPGVLRAAEKATFVTARFRVAPRAGRRSRNQASRPRTFRRIFSLDATRASERSPPGPTKPPRRARWTNSTVHTPSEAVARDRSGTAPSDSP